MNEHLKMEERLWDYLDGHCNMDEHGTIEKLIAENIEWKKKYHELLELHQSLQMVSLDEPSMRFTKNVMEEISKRQIAPATRSYINKKIIWGIAGFFLSMFIGFLIYGFSQVHFNAGSSNGTLLSDYSNTINKYDWGKFFSSTYTNIFIMVNIVLGLVFLDMFLRRKVDSE